MCLRVFFKDPTGLEELLPVADTTGCSIFQLRHHGV